MTVNLHKAIFHNYWELPPDVGEARIYKVEYSCTGEDDRCGHTFDPCLGKGNVPEACYALTPDARGLTWFRVWDGDPADVTYTVYYEKPRLECVANCPPS